MTDVEAAWHLNHLFILGFNERDATIELAISALKERALQTARRLRADLAARELDILLQSV